MKMARRLRLLIGQLPRFFPFLVCNPFRQSAAPDAWESMPPSGGFSLLFRVPDVALLFYFIPLTIPHEAPDSRSFLSDFAADQICLPKSHPYPPPPSRTPADAYAWASP